MRKMGGSDPNGESTDPKKRRQQWGNGQLHEEYHVIFSKK